MSGCIVGVIGLGKFGFKLGQTLVNLGEKVVGLDNDPEKVKRTQNVFTQVYQADASRKEVLDQLGFSDLVHVLISVGDSVAASSMITMYLKELGVPKVWVKAVNADHEKLLRKVGADEVIIPEHMAAQQLANRIAKPGFIEYLPFDKNMVIREMVVNRWGGNTITQLDIANRFDIQIIAVRKKKGEAFQFIPRGDTLLERDDTLVAIGKGATLDKLLS
ncbi:MAG: TrkA family potassium uptake protein [Deltaproteobacteria bacterium]